MGDRDVEKVLITGGGGFLGKAIAAQLISHGYKVSTFSRSPKPELEQMGCKHILGDLARARSVIDACKNQDAVIHTAAHVVMWGGYDDFYQINVKGTESVLAGCRENGIKKLVFTSSPSVVFAGKDQEGVDETEPYPDNFLAHYPRTKAAAERMVMQANDQDLATVCLRPHLIWGPHDPHVVANIIEKAQTKKLRFVGSPEKKIDAVYVDNAAYSHRLALEKLAVGSPIAGKTYFITNHEPWETREFINGVLGAAGEPPISKSVPSAVAYGAGALLEKYHSLVKPDSEPRMTRFMAKILSTSHWFDPSAARNELGYEPKVSMKQGMERLKESFG